MKVEQILGLAYLRSGMTLERHSRIGFRHAFSIINNLDAGASGIHNQNIYLGCSGIERVLDKLLYDRRRTLNNLSRSNLVSNRIGKQLNYIGHDV